ncbi:MAG: AsmA family protein [Chitinophagales bacterium]
MLKKVLIITTCVVLLLVGGASTWIYLNQDTIQNKAIAAINEQINAEIIVDGNIDITFLSTFPDVSLQLENVFIADPFNPADTLASLQKVNCTLDAIALLKKNYTIDAIAVSDGLLRLKIDEEGKNNFDILKKDETTKSENTAIHLEKININNVKVDFEDKKDDILLYTYVNAAILKGSFINQDFEIATYIDTDVQDLTINKMTFLHNHQLKGEAQLNYTGTTQCIRFLKNEIAIQNNDFTFEGDICVLDNQINLQATASGNQVENALQLIPKDLLNLEGINGKGNYTINALIEGDLNEPTIAFDFTLGNGEIEMDEMALKLTDVNTSGTFHNRNTPNGSVELHSFSLNSNNSHLNGTITMPDLAVIKAKMLINGNIDYQSINQFVGGDLSLIEGNILIENGGIDFTYRSDSNWVVSQMDGNYNIENIQGKILTINKDFNLTATISAAQNKATFSSASATIGDNDFSYEGTLSNYLSYFQKDIFGNAAPLGISGTLSSQNFNIDDFLQDENTEEKSAERPDLSRWLNATGSIKGNFANFKYQNLTLNDISLLLESNKPGAIDINLLYAKGLNGDMDGAIQLFFQENQDMDLTLTANVNAIAIDQLFESFDNFGQDGLTADNIKGNLSSKIMLATTFKNFTQFSDEDLLMNADINITDGELISLDMLMSLSKYLTVEQLEHLYFTDLDATVSIQDKKISLPTTTIQSNLLTLDLGGTHTFDNQIDYTLRLNLKNLLAAKFKKNKTTDEEYINDAEGGINLFISMTGDMDDPVIVLDKEKKKEWKKEDWTEEKQELKDIFKKDSIQDVEATDYLYFEEDSTEYIDWE